MYTFIWYTFGIVGIDNFFNKEGQTLHCLTFEKTYMHYIVAMTGILKPSLSWQLDKIGT
jgi:hypothetical protein